jgi:hypothetical protein
VAGKRGDILQLVDHCNVNIFQIIGGCLRQLDGASMHSGRAGAGRGPVGGCLAQPRRITQPTSTVTAALRKRDLVHKAQERARIFNTRKWTQFRILFLLD